MNHHSYNLNVIYGFVKTFMIISMNWKIPLLLGMTVWLNLVNAHAFFVTGSLSTIPSPTKTNEPFRLQLDMIDPAQVPVEDATVMAEFTSEGQNQPLTFKFSDSGTPGQYVAEVILPKDGLYQLVIRDQTYQQEEARATLEFNIGSTDTISFIFPPTQTGGNNLQTWLIWVIAVPVLAGIIVTVLVLLNTKKSDADKSEK
jgi:ABC-type transport system involved in multi-copper enzyme maturation permease subunit